MTSRRTLLFSASAFLLPVPGMARAPQTIEWDDLIPPGVPYAEIIGEGEIDYAADTWKPVYDANAVKLNPALDGALVRLPGYILPLDFDGAGVTSFILVPYVGACVHTPPPPPNQLVFVETATPWPSDSLWDAVWVTGMMRAQMQSTELAEIGYGLTAEKIEIFQW